MNPGGTVPTCESGAVVRHNLRVREVIRSPQGEAAADLLVVDGEWPADTAWPEWMAERADGRVGDAQAWRARVGPRAQDWRLSLRRDQLVHATGSLAGLADVCRAYETRAFCMPLPGGLLTLSCDHPCLMGIVNVTPDSFSDGGLHGDPSRAVAHGLALVEAGAGVLDVGGESTRPGSDPVPADEELRRVLPVVQGLAKQTDVPLSVDTRRAAVAGPVLEAGAQIINDTSAGRDDPHLAPLVGRWEAGLVLMHRLGTPRTMQDQPSYRHCRAEVAAFLRGAVARSQEAGVSRARLLVDPGLGFGKREEDNCALLAGLREFRSLGVPVLLGASRKRFLGRITGREVGERGAATLATTAVALREGAAMVRVHDVQGSRDLLRVLAVLSDG